MCWVGKEQGKSRSPGHVQATNQMSPHEKKVCWALLQSCTHKNLTNKSMLECSLLVTEFCFLVRLQIRHSWTILGAGPFLSNDFSIQIYDLYTKNRCDNRQIKISVENM